MARLPAEHSFTAGLLMLTASTGIIDAASYLALDRVFTGNMTGNVLFIGFALGLALVFVGGAALLAAAAAFAAGTGILVATSRR